MLINSELPKDIEEMCGFLEKFIFFHLGRDAIVEVISPPGENLVCSISHIRIKDIQFELDYELKEKFEQDISAFEDYLLEILTGNRRGLSIDD